MRTVSFDLFGASAAVPGDAPATTSLFKSLSSSGLQLRLLKRGILQSLIRRLSFYRYNKRALATPKEFVRANGNSALGQKPTCTNVRFWRRLCENSDVELARRKFVSITLNNKRTALAVTVERRKERKQFCAFSAGARFHTAWAQSGHTPERRGLPSASPGSRKFHVRG